MLCRLRFEPAVRGTHLAKDLDRRGRDEAEADLTAPYREHLDCAWDALTWRQ